MNEHDAYATHVRHCKRIEEVPMKRASFEARRDMELAKHRSYFIVRGENGHMIVGTVFGVTGRCANPHHPQE